MLPSAAMLQGMTLDGGWRVIEPIPMQPGATGSNFSICYYVENTDGRRAFLKALDYSRAFRSRDPARVLQFLTESFNFERDVLAKCKEERLDHVVLAITDGVVRVNNSADGGVVQYLIFELADGDVRRQADVNKRFDTAWSLRTLHHVAIGLLQIHKHDIAHQDLKPSNVLVFEKKDSKIADFGRSAYKGHIPPYDSLEIQGDPTYAPPELLYHFLAPDWYDRKFSCDGYLLGSMVVFFFTGIPATTQIFSKLPGFYHYDNWQGTYNEVLPYLQDAFQQVLQDFCHSIPESLQKDLLQIVSQLCEPNPQLRGNPKNHYVWNRISMERYVSWFNLLATRAELGLVGYR